MLSYSFYTNNLNKNKYELLKNKALLIRDFKNKVSNYIFDNKLNDKGFLDKKLSRISIQKECKYFKPDISERMYDSAILEVITMYNNRKQEVRKPFRRPILFSKLTFSNTNVLSKNRHSNIIGFNENNKSKMKYFLKLSSFYDVRGKLLIIPIKENDNYHGNLEEFNYSESNTSQFNISYIVQFTDNKNEIRFILTKESSEKEEIILDHENVVGIDVNVKHNLFTLSNGAYFDHNRNFIDSYLSFLKYLDNKASNKSYNKNKERLLSRQDQKNYNSKLRSLDRIYNEQVRNVIDYCKQEGFNTIVLEDLGMLPKSFARMSEEFKGFKVSRLSRLLRLAELKNIFTRIAKKHDMKVVLVNPAYTSQQCSDCNHISKDNRKTQEIFHCVKCDLDGDADMNAAINIKQRYTLYNEVNSLKHHKQIKTFFEDLS